MFLIVYKVKKRVVVFGVRKKFWLTRVVLGFARSYLGGLIIGWWFTKLSYLITSSKLRETDSLVAFHHPKPSYPFHALIVPKNKIKDITDLGNLGGGFQYDLFDVTASIVDEFDLVSMGFRLILNGGRFQEVSQLHFHLVGGLEENSEQI